MSIGRFNAGPILPRLKPLRNQDDLRRRVGQFGYLGLNLVAHRAYVRQVKAHAIDGLMQVSSFQIYKYLGDYLARSFRRSARRVLILSHYRFVGDRLTQRARAAILGDGLRLWERMLGDQLAGIVLRTSHAAPMEGEWQLQFHLGSEVIYTLSFLFAPATGFRAPGDTVCLIGGVQGGYACRDHIRVAARENFEIAPITMLILAAKAIAAALGVEAVFGVSSAEQVVRLYAANRMQADYDAIWASEGAFRQVNGFYALSHDLVERDLTTISRSHRRRTRLKRQRKAELLAAMTAQAKAALLG